MKKITEKILDIMFNNKPYEEAKVAGLENIDSNDLLSDKINIVNKEDIAKKDINENEEEIELERIDYDYDDNDDYDLNRVHYNSEYKSNNTLTSNINTNTNNDLDTITKDIDEIEDILDECWLYKDVEYSEGLFRKYWNICFNNPLNVDKFLYDMNLITMYSKYLFDTKRIDDIPEKIADQIFLAKKGYLESISYWQDACFFRYLVEKHYISPNGEFKCDSNLKPLIVSNDSN